MTEDSVPPSNTSVKSKKEHSRRSSTISRRTTEIMSTYPDEKDNLDKAHPFRDQFKAMFYRRWIGLKRSWGSVLSNLLVTLVVSCLAIAVKYFMESVAKDTSTLYNFSAFPVKPHALAVVASDYPNYISKPFQKRYINAIYNVFNSDVGYPPDIHVFPNLDEANKYIYDCKNNDVFVAMGIQLPEEFNPNGGNNLTMIWNDTVKMNTGSATFPNMSYISYSIMYRVELATLSTVANMSDTTYDSVPPKYKMFINAFYDAVGFSKHADFGPKYSMYTGKGRDVMFAIASPLLIAAGLTSVISIFIVVPITDIQGPIRAYMVSCGLQVLPYWIVTFVFDFIYWTIEVLLVWVIFIIADVSVFTENKGVSFYIMFICGPSLILFIYVISFIFNTADSASRNAFICDIILLMIPLIVTLVTLDMEDPLGSFQKIEWTGWIYELFPPLLLEGYMQHVFTEYSYNKEGLKYYFKNASAAQPYSIFAFVDIIIYGVILIIIEKWRIYIQRKSAKSNFGDYHEFFETEKNKHPVTEEAHQMEKEVEASSDYAVRIHNVSRLFFNTEGKHIPAVNCVSLGVKEGSIFGFLGANGAGKTTLINMITSLLPPSDGTIHIHGKDIMTDNDPSKLSVCPQFNTHLCMDMTIAEHFHFYSLLQGMSPQHEEKNSKRLLEHLELNDFKDLPIRELSEGDARKLAIALSFLGKASIILLDEPTATLDPVSRKQIHEMILYYKGQKTFMLCTHLLSEAEFLCDTISIMIKGNVYTVGSP